MAVNVYCKLFFRTEDLIAFFHEILTCTDDYCKEQISGKPDEGNNRKIHEVYIIYVRSTTAERNVN